jgi:glucose/arabinose dehydrogenase
MPSYGTTSAGTQTVATEWRLLKWLSQYLNQPARLPRLPQPRSIDRSDIFCQPYPAETAGHQPGAGLAGETTLPDPAGYSWTEVANGLSSPIGLFNAGDGSGRLFILEQPGQIRVVKGGELLLGPFLDIRERVGSQGSEQGLLGLAFHPRFSENGLFFANYTDQNGDTVIARFSVSGDNPDRADPGSEKQLLFVDQPYANHNGGMLAFGPDGYLYIGLGDGGSGGDPQGNGQNKNALLGKILRIDVDSGDPYAIPADNPFANGGSPSLGLWAATLARF